MSNEHYANDEASTGLQSVIEELRALKVMKLYTKLRITLMVERWFLYQPMEQIS